MSKKQNCFLCELFVKKHKKTAVVRYDVKLRLSSPHERSVFLIYSELLIELEVVVGTLRRRHSVALAYMDSADNATVGRYYVVFAGLGRNFTRIELFHFNFLLVLILFIVLRRFMQDISKLLFLFSLVFCLLIAYKSSILCVQIKYRNVA